MEQPNIHELTIISFYDARAKCKCGWNFTATGERTIKEIREVYSNHLDKSKGEK